MEILFFLILLSTNFNFQVYLCGTIVFFYSEFILKKYKGCLKKVFAMCLMANIEGFTSLFNFITLLGSKDSYSRKYIVSKRYFFVFSKYYLIKIYKKKFKKLMVLLNFYWLKVMKIDIHKK